MATDDADRAARLLLKALGTLSERERDLVLRNLLTGRVGQSRDLGPRLHSGSMPMVAHQELGAGVVRQVEQPLLVRLPTDLHGRFRRWATTHGFSMASVVRGLVERFLDEQEGRPRSRSRPS